MDRSPSRLQQLEPLERLQLALEGLVALLAQQPERAEQQVQQPERAEQQVQVPLGELQQELGE